MPHRDALCRVTWATTPEATNTATNFYCTTSASALCAGNPSALCRRTDARGITTTSTYDALNRLTGKSYSNGEASVSYFYDQTSYNGLTITNGLGRRTGMSDASGQTAWSYDAMGNVVTEQRTIAGITKTISYTHNLDGALGSITYPSGRTVTYTYDTAGRVATAIDTANSVNYAKGTCGPSADSACYAPHGALASILNGPSGTFGGVTASYSYNNRLLSASSTASSSNGTVLNLSYSYFADANVSTVTNNLNTNRTETVTYDNLNRIATAQSQATSGTDCWGQSYGYDRYGNFLSITVTRCSAPALGVSVNTHNQITNAGFTYDAAGNLTADGTYSYAWNAENHLTSAAGVNYTYDGNLQRTKKSSGTLYWYGVSGEVLAETDLSGNTTAEYVYFEGQRIAGRDSSGAVHYFFADHLGSLRVLTNATGGVERDDDYYAFGGEIVETGTVDDSHKFAGMELDSEDGLYHTLFRQYSPSLGRWLGTDPVRGCAENPQGLNLYPYVRNNPANLIDPRGDQFCDPYFGCYYYYYWFYFRGSITIHFQCPDNKSSCCSYYDNLAANPRASLAERGHARLAKFVCQNTGSDCFDNCVRSCLVSYSQRNCDPLLASYSRLYCREVSAHAACLTLCAFWFAVPGLFSGDPHFTIPVPYPVYINFTVTVPYRCSSTRVGGGL